MIESTIISWIGTTTAASTRVSVGARLQSAALPALVIELGEGSAAALNGGTPKLDRYELTMNAVAETMISAQSLAAEAVAKVVAGEAAVGGCAYETRYAVIQAPIVGEGDEVEPAVCAATLTILHKS